MRRVGCGLTFVMRGFLVFGALVSFLMLSSPAGAQVGATLSGMGFPPERLDVSLSTQRLSGIDLAGGAGRPLALVPSQTVAPEREVAA